MWSVIRTCVLKIGNQLFDRTLSLVTDPAEKAAVLQARAKKYPYVKHHRMTTDWISCIARIGACPRNPLFRDLRIAE